MENPPLVCPCCRNHLKPYKGIMEAVERKCRNRSCGMEWVVTFHEDPNREPSYRAAQSERVWG